MSYCHITSYLVPCKVELDIILPLRTWLDVSWCPFIADSKLKLRCLTSHIDPYLIHISHLFTLFMVFTVCSFSCAYIICKHMQTCVAATASLHCLLHLRSQTKSKCYRGATKEAPGSLASAKCFFWGNIWCMEDPPKIAHMDLVWLCWSCGKPKRSETKKCVDTNKNRWNHIDLRLVLTMLQCLCMEFIQVEYSLNDIQPPESPCTFPLKYIKILGSRRAWLPTAMVRVHLQPWNSEKPVTVGWCRQMEKSWELVTSVKKHDLPNRRNLSR